MRLVLEVLGPIIRFVIIALFEVKEKQNEAIEATDNDPDSSREFFSRKLL